MSWIIKCLTWNQNAIASWMTKANETKNEIYKTVFHFVIFKVKTNFTNNSNVIKWTKKKWKLNDYQMEAGIGTQNLKKRYFLKYWKPNLKHNCLIAT